AGRASKARGCGVEPRRDPQACPGPRTGPRTQLCPPLAGRADPASSTARLLVVVELLEPEDGAELVHQLVAVGHAGLVLGAHLPALDAGLVGEVLADDPGQLGRGGRRERLAPVGQVLVGLRAAGAPGPVA